MPKYSTAIALALLLAATINTGCNRNDEIRTQQRQILAKLNQIDKKLDGVVQRPSRRGPTGPDPARVYDIPPANSPILGPGDAPVTIVEFSDFQCPFCSRVDPVLKQVLAQYPKQVRLIYKNLPLTSIHPYALGAAQAAVAAQKQGKFWEMHDLLFANQRALQPDALKSYAQRLGLDVAKFEADSAAAETMAAIQDDIKLSRTVGVRGTPTLFVNGKILADRSLGGFKAVIDPLLAKANG
jgi:protein-disulfide isomerase